MYEIDIPPDMQRKLPYSNDGFYREHFPIFDKMLYNIVEEQHPMTVRQVYYRAVVKGMVEKNGRGYAFVQKRLRDRRWDGMIPVAWIVDESRRIRGFQGSPTETIDEYIERKIRTFAHGYSIDLLGDLDYSIQIWVEKEALLGIFEPITSEWGVPLVPAKGYASLSFLLSAARDLESMNRPAKIFQFGDYDPSGQNALKVVQRDLVKWAPKTKQLGIEFNIVAVTPQQIEEMNLPKRPTNMDDPRSISFDSDDSVDLDAMEPDVLRQVINDTIAGCFPENVLEEKRRKEEDAVSEIQRRFNEMLGR
jgi:hypothetical protein